jgi:hypothetical protein
MKVQEVSIDPAQTKTSAGESDPTSAGSTNARPEANELDSNWINFQNHQRPEQGQEVQRNMQSLAIGSLPSQRVTDITNGSSNYINSEGSNHGGDAGLSPDTAHSSSNRPTPNSTTPSESRTNLQPGATSSSGTSYETSPASSHNAHLSSADGRSMSSFFNAQSDYTNIPTTGLTSGAEFSMPETPGRGFDVPSGWEMSNQTNSLTPVGEGVLRQLMGLGPLDPM